jgi:hypothetical protein
VNATAASDERTAVVIDVSMTDLDTAGTFKSRVVVSSPDLAKEAAVPITIVVKDSWWFPMFVILAGIVVAALMSYVSQRLRPTLENRYRSDRLWGDVAHFRYTAKSPAKIQKINEILEALRRADQTLGAAEAKAILDDVSKQLDAYRAAEATLRASVNTSLADARKAVENAATSADEASRKEVRQVVGNIERMLGEDKVDEADEARRELQQKLEKLQAHPPGKGLITERMGALRLTVAGSAEGHLVDSPILFEVDVGSPPMDRVFWYFEDIGKEEEGKPKTIHRFARAGTYLVKVTAECDGVPAVAEATVLVRDPAPADDLKTIRRMILATEIGQSAVAAAIATLTAMLGLYANKPFGTLTDYLTAFLWGFGVDATVKGFVSVFQKVRGGATT